MKSYKPLLLILVTCLSLPLYAANSATSSVSNTQEYNPDTARAYEAYLLTFVWPKQESSEEVKYKNVLSTADLPRFQDQDANSQQDSASAATNISQLTVPFDDFKNKIAPHAKVLVNQKWTLIFKQTGDTISKAFHSDAQKNGYPELTGKISIKLAHYLESDIHYKHYLFDSLPDMVNTSPTKNDGAAISSGTDALTDPSQAQAPGPTLVLDVEQKNKTASKKLNYIDHPVLGTLLYFVPINLDDAINQVSLENITQQSQDEQPSTDKPTQLTPTDEQ